MSMTRAQIATQLLNEMAPKGEKLAYINNREAELLKRMGGAGVDINKTGIKSYFDPGSGRGSVSESLNQAAFGSSGPTFSSDGGSGSFTPKGNFATITKDKGDISKGSGAVTATSFFPKYFKNFQYNTPPGISIDKLRNLAIKTASENSITDLLKGVLTDPDKFDPDFKRGSQIKASYPQYVKEGILSALGFKPTSQIGGGTNAGRALLEKIGSIPGAKTVGRALPGIGTVSGIYDVGSRLSQGDYFGAGLGALSAVPFAGIPAAAAQAAYDYSRAKFARGGNTGYSDFASPSSTTASQDFSTQAVSGGQTDYGGGGDGNDQPITEIRPNFNYNIDRSLIDPRLNFKNIEAIIYLQEFLDKQAKGEDVDLEADINYNAPFLESGLASLAYNTNRGFTAGLSGNLTPNLRGGVSFQDGQQNVNFNYNKGPFSAGIASGPQGYDARFGVNYEFAKGGRINYARGGRMSETAASYSSPTARAADDRFSPPSDSGGSYDYIPQPTVAELNKINTPGDGTYVNPNKTVIETLRDSNLSPSFQRRAIDRFLADEYARKVNRLTPYVVGDMDEDYYFGDLPTAESLGLKNSPTTLPGEKTNIPVIDLLDKAFAPPATLEGAIATRNKMQGIYDDIGRIGQLGFEDKYMNNPPPTIDGGDSQPIKLPIIAEAPSDVDGTLSDFDLYMQNLRTAQPNPFMLDPRFAAAQGGVARQAYGLGSIVKKATKAVKKIVKSDIGKAAIGLASLYYGPKLFGADKGFSNWKDVSLLKSMKGGNALKYILGASAAAGLASSQEEDEDLDQISSREDKSGLREQMATYKPFRFELQSPYRLAANGGRIGYEEGGNINPADLPMSRESLPTYEDIETGEEVEYPYENKERSSAPDIDAELFQMYLDAIGSGKIPRSTTFDQYKELMGEKASMGPERTMANEGGLMNLGGNEMDLRGGGFVPLGAKEKADDVPARLSKNEFVFTADAVRAAGGGDVDRGANLMYKTMKNLESRVG
jgi:hypothetical protein